MINLSRIQLELERAKEGLREVEETIQKVEGKAFPNGPGRYSNLKVQLHADKSRNPISNEDGKLQRRTIASNIEPRNRRISTDDLSFSLKRGPRDKRDVGLKRPGFEGRPQSITARLTGIAQQTADDEDDDEFTKKLALPSRVITTASEAPSRQEIIAAQTGDELIKQRNRRMFGALMGTLQKFCKEETRVRDREEKRLRVEKKLEEDAKREKEKLLQEKRELFLERKRREIEIKRIEWSLNRVKEYEAWEANVLPLKNFIQTHAKPHIFYLPSVHNSKTEERLAQSQRIVERMIEKRKNNLKEEIENSERKARRTVAEEEEEEEAENIPQNSESAQNVEQPVAIDFDGGSKENGFHEEDSKTQREEAEHSKESEEPNKDEGEWSDKEAEGEEKGAAVSDSENKSKSTFEGAEESASQEPNNSSNLCGSSEATGNNNEGDSDGDGGGGDKNSGAYEATGEGRTFDADAQAEDNERNEPDTLENVTKESESDVAQKVPVSECENEGNAPVAEENVQMEEDQPVTEGIAEITSKPEDKVTDDDNNEKKESLSECEGKADRKDDDKKVDDTKKDKSSESSRRREDSPARKSKGGRNFRSPGRRSRSPRRFTKTRRRSRSGSRRRKSYRRRSRSHSKSASPSSKTRRDRSPRTRRRSERTSSSSRRKSPHSRSRRRSSSKSSSSASPRKRMKFRSPSSSNSRSDSD